MAKKMTKKSAKKTGKKSAKKPAAKSGKAAKASAPRSASAKKPSATAKRTSTAKKSSSAKKPATAKKTASVKKTVKKTAAAKMATPRSKPAGGRSAASASSARPARAMTGRPTGNDIGNAGGSNDRSPSDAPRSFNPTRLSATSPAPVIDDDRDDEDRNDIDVIPGREGADIVTPRELGDGEHISSDLDDGNGDDADDGSDENL